MKYLPLTRGQFAILDDDDYEELSKYKWQCTKNGYASRDVMVAKQTTRIFMHRVVNKTPQGFDTDHISRDKLDNRKSNLRTVTRSQNMSNSMQKNNTSGYRGVHQDKRTGNWLARAKVSGVYKHLGSFKDPEEAYKVYCAAVELRFT